LRLSVCPTLIYGNGVRMNFQEHMFEEFGKVNLRLTLVEKEVHIMRKNFPKWAITGGFLAGIVVSFGHHLMGCNSSGGLSPAGTVAVDSAVCALNGYLGAVQACSGNWNCVEKALPGIALKCALQETQVRQVISAHLTTEFGDMQYVSKDSNFLDGGAE
jgi:hypothetical protein